MAAAARFAAERVTFTEGRPPWYNSEGCLKQPLIIGVCGGTASGKTTVCRKIVERLKLKWVVLLSMDSFYRGLDKSVVAADYDFDAPAAIDHEEMIRALRSLKECQVTYIPTYDFVTHQRTHSTPMYGADVILVEGLLTFYWQELRDLFDVKIFVDTDMDTRLARRLRRDIAERGRTVDGVLKQYERFVKPAFTNFIAPTMTYADIVLPFATENDVGIDLLCQHVQTTLKKRGFVFRDDLAKQSHEMPSTLVMLPQTQQVKALHTVMRDQATDREDFVFYSQRLTRLLVELAMTCLPADDVTITTPTGSSYEGKRMTGRLCGVSVIRAGEAMEGALREVCKDVRLGKILIQNDAITKTPKLFYCKLPQDVQDRYCLVMDPVIGTGATAMMAIRILLDHGVKEDRILFLALIASSVAVSNVCYAFPKVKFVCTALDDEVDERFYVMPGVGNFGDRHYGTDSSRPFSRTEDAFVPTTPAK